MAAKALPAQDVLHQLLSYDPETGKLFWKTRPESMFSSAKQSAAHNAAIWNAKNAGKEAFTTALPDGHRYSTIYRHKFLAHRVIWKMTNGDEPVGIDHIDGNPGNNRISNLRPADQTTNGRNQALRKNNSSGVLGVRWDERLGKWHVRIMVNRKTVHLGVFKEFHEAVAARKAAELEYGFHRNHGRAA